MTKKLDSIGYWYLASPYSKYPKGLEAAFIEVSKAAAQLIKQGVRIYCPISHSHPIAIYGKIDPLDHSLWLAADKPFMDGARGLIVLKMDTWENSFGIGVEIEAFKAAGKPIQYMEWP